MWYCRKILSMHHTMASSSEAPPTGVSSPVDPISLTVNVTAASAPPFPRLSLAPAGVDDTTSATTDVLISIVPPVRGARPPTDVCCVVDCSGSMGVECQNGRARV